eukprot:s2974_g18.t1
MTKVKKNHVKKKSPRPSDQDNKLKKNEPKKAKDAKTVTKKEKKPADVKDKSKDKKEKKERREKKEKKVCQKQDKNSKGSKKEKAGDNKGKNAGKSMERSKKEKNEKKGKNGAGNPEPTKTEKGESKKAKQQEVTRQPALRPSPGNPTSRRVSFKSAQEAVQFDPTSAPASLSSLRTPSPKRPCVSPSVTSSTSVPESLVALRKEASEKGVTLEAYMEDLSRQELEHTVEEHMRALITETKDAKNLENEENKNLENKETKNLKNTEVKIPEDEKEDEDEELMEEVEPLSSDSSSSTSEADSSDQESAAPETEADQQEDEMGEEDVGDSDGDDEGEEQEEEDEEDDLEADDPDLDQEIDALMDDPTKSASAVTEKAETKTTVHKDNKDKEKKEEQESSKTPENKQLKDVVKAQDAAQEIYYYTNEGNEVKHEDITSEGVSLKISETGNKDLVESLTVEGGPLQCGVLLDADAATDAGRKDLVESITQAGVAVAKARPAKKEKAEKLEPKTMLESEAQFVCELGRVQIDQLASEKMEQCLQKGAQARKYSISLGSLEYSGDLSQQMLQFSTKMEKIYRNLRDLVDKKSTCEDLYEKFFQAAAKGLQTGLKPKKAKAKGKAKAKPSAPKGA